jgi:hypothetical protein
VTSPVEAEFLLRRCPRLAFPLALGSVLAGGVSCSTWIFSVALPSACLLPRVVPLGETVYLHCPRTDWSAWVEHHQGGCRRVPAGLPFAGSLRVLGVASASDLFLLCVGVDLHLPSLLLWPLCLFGDL